MSGHYPSLMGDLKIQQPAGGMLHDLPVGVAAHDDPYQWLIHLHSSPGTIHRASCGQGCLSGRQPSDRHSKGRAGHIVHAQSVAKGYGGGIPSVLPTDPELEVRANATPQLAGHADELADPCLVQYLERVVLDDAVFQIVRKEATGIITRQPPGGLSQIVGPEREELGFSSQLIRRESRTR